MGARVRAGSGPRGRAADGLDQFGRHAPAGAAKLRQRRGGGRLLRAPWHRLSGDGSEDAGAPHDLLFRQLCLQAPRSLDALTSSDRYRPITVIPEAVNLSITSTSW